MLELPGYAHVFLFEGRSYLRTDEGVFLRFGDDERPRLDRQGAISLLEPDDEEIAESLSEFLPARRGWAPLQRCFVDGNGRTADVLRSTLEDRLTDSLEEADVVISAVDGPPPEHWRALGEQLQAAGTAWHRVHLEAGVAHVGPLTVWGESAGHEDVRKRRIAASPHPELLKALWAQLPEETPPMFVTSLVIGCILADLDVGTHSDDLRLIRTDGTISHHPVLPWPAGLQTEKL